MEAAIGAVPPGAAPSKKENRAWARFKRNKMAMASLVIMIILVLLALLAPVIAPHDPAEQDLLNRLKPPSAAHWFGTDDLGRDLFSRVLYGARVSLSVGIVSVVLNVIIGVTVGSLAGYYGGRVDAVLMRFVDMMLAFPSLFVMIAVVTLLRPSLFNIILVFVVFGWMSKARLLRGQILTVKNREFVEAARTIGMSDARIIFVHILPNSLAPVIISATLQMGTMILTESTLSYLGLGIQPPAASWGNLLQSAQNLTILMKAPWLPFIPGFMIFLTIMSFNFIGDGLRSALDAK
ncbi:oligopeptide ABC transporter permease [Paenibacillus mucilaginosus]|uniref:Oligopeptide ABC transporter membrane protein n=3 Tax=Paenibacillus mucilaginosus TaxID=61624 RepID=H6NKB9_9BACL|nr:oligopeptide ABC transporter permease [Paenibacillus mucilaginosus]AEI44022.1 oligopeptide ABC transporter membrane protein [Paenibacillus mucilaginosus KNP414]AFC31603.1 oligopeptide ABC transporter membrane protein [Paenibacillus mucilaginosus 3016]AFH63951.1 peptide ABC transporter permease [Paenibacillus mucilaginosus K02]MCG7212490.1 ABC transporter permease [Paenibacillus mucilaginosus]WDM25475.1 ABC transporter permease [Paenibacillus mucilaginosus]